ncbi:helix-turn-helix transcriptional regulator [Curtobacterium sp. MCSS17_016]|uniref:helix-turn-helix domain-containing protein n=1 Tax=Curtobacterium sp. MCSS17_016 TaxID=2175644 RepID=UPI001C64EDA9|nr:helix-turn-helix transcriptional regulator [Curtobacterium sp. MCSS17_016]WIE81270.1 helix-turn-helix transcriptional regulator [Curtobacterium sp. MCSS17_016]
MTTQHAPAIADILDRLRAGDHDAIRHAIAGIEAASAHIRAPEPGKSAGDPWDAGYARGLASVEQHMVNAMHRAGQTLDSDLDRRADALISSTESTLRALIALRIKRGLTVETVADRMGVSTTTVTAFEAYDADPTQSIIQRYAMAVGARITTAVSDDEAPADDAAATVPLKTAQDEVEYRVRTAVARVVAAHRHGGAYPGTFVGRQIRDGKARLDAAGGHIA